MARLGLLLALLTVPAADAGVTVVNLELYARWCVETDAAPTFELRAHKGSIIRLATLTASQHRQLVALADYDPTDWQTTCAPLEAAASSMLGTWWMSLNAADREQFCFWYDELG